jgi:Asp-tRNA(Asn)/Glu-tRNA(Gln) amidotransferase A subunit family amidase
MVLKKRSFDMTLGDLAALSATDIVALVKARQISPVEVIEASLGRIERYNPTLNAVVTLNEQAIEDASALEASIKPARASKCFVVSLSVSRI